MTSLNWQTMKPPFGTKIWELLHATAYMLTVHMLSQFRPSVRPSVTQVIHAKTAEVRIMQFSPYSSPIAVVFAG